MMSVCSSEYLHNNENMILKGIFGNLDTAPSVNIKENYYALKVEYQFLLNMLLKHDHLLVAVAFQKN